MDALDTARRRRWTPARRECLDVLLGCALVLVRLQRTGTNLSPGARLGLKYFVLRLPTPPRCIRSVVPPLDAPTAVARFRDPLCELAATALACRLRDLVRRLGLSMPTSLRLLEGGASIGEETEEAYDSGVATADEDADEDDPLGEAKAALAQPSRVAVASGDSRSASPKSTNRKRSVPGRWRKLLGFTSR